MDPSRSRRRVLGLLAGAAGTLALGPQEVVVAKRAGGRPCHTGRQCKTGKCVGAKGQKTCSCSQKHLTCSTDSPCRTATCDVAAKRCVSTADPTQNGVPCANGACQQGVCLPCCGNADPCVVCSGSTPTCHNGVCDTCAATCGANCVVCNLLADGTTLCGDVLSSTCQPCAADADCAAGDRCQVSWVDRGSNVTFFPCGDQGMFAVGACSTLTGCA